MLKKNFNQKNKDNAEKYLKHVFSLISIYLESYYIW